MIVDVVMETEHAGLELVRHVREQLKNRLSRIVLRTGHPGQAPEREVIRAYDINDYKEKTELTAHKLETTVLVALRGYRDLMMIEAARQGLERVVEASAQIHSRQQSHEFARRCSRSWRHWSVCSAARCIARCRRPIMRLPVRSTSPRQPASSSPRSRATHG